MLSADLSDKDQTIRRRGELEHRLSSRWSQIPSQAPDGNVAANYRQAIEARKRTGTKLVLFDKRYKLHRSHAPKQRRTLEGRDSAPLHPVLEKNDVSTVTTVIAYR
jgi:hypothetical protein